MVCTALYLSLVVLALEAYPFGTGDPAVRVALASFVFISAVAGSVLPGRALGAGWLRCVISAFGAHAVASALAFGLLPSLEPFDGWGSYLAIEFAVAVTITVLLCASDLSWPARLSVVGVATVSLLISLPFENIGLGLIPALAGVFCWITLPALASLLLE